VDYFRAALVRAKQTVLKSLPVVAELPGVNRNKKGNENLLKQSLEKV